MSRHGSRSLAVSTLDGGHPTIVSTRRPTMARTTAEQPPLSIRLINEDAIKVVHACAIERGCPKSLPQILAAIVQEWYASKTISQVPQGWSVEFDQLNRIMQGVSDANRTE
jgi:hypothetical protein